MPKATKKNPTRVSRTATRSTTRRQQGQPRPDSPPPRPISPPPSLDQSQDTQPAPTTSAVSSSSVEARLDQLESLVANQARLDALLKGQAREIIRLKAAADPSTSAVASGPSIPAQTTPPQDLTSPSTAQQLTTSSTTAIPEPRSDLATQALQIFSAQDDVNSLSGTLSPFLLLGATLPESVKSKICAGNFVDLATLRDLPANQDHSLEFAMYDNKPRVSLASTRPNPVSSPMDWLSLFLRYASVYVDAHPHEGPGLFTYISTILDLSITPGYLWRDYDVKFRTLRPLTPSALPWGRLNHDVHASIQLYRAPQPSNQPFRPTYRRQLPSGTCHTFLINGVCHNAACPWPHNKGSATKSTAAGSRKDSAKNSSNASNPGKRG